MQERQTISPAFAREAAEHLREGNIQHAIQLCLRGTKAFPHYATGHLVLGKCYEAFGKSVETLDAYRQAINILPDNPTLQSLVKKAEEREQQEFSGRVAEQEKRVEGKKDTVPPDKFVAEKPSNEQEESYIEFLAKRLQDIKRIPPTASSASEHSIPPVGERSVKFVTATMAEIYVGQGQYAEAINAFTQLAKQHPEEEKTYKNRVNELEELLAIQRKELKLEDPQNKKAS